MTNEECNMPTNPYDCWNCKTAAHFWEIGGMNQETVCENHDCPRWKAEHEGEDKRQ